MPSPVRVLVIGSGDHATRAFSRLTAQSGMSVWRLPDAQAAGNVCGPTPHGLVPHVVVLESSCLVMPNRERLRALMDAAPVILLGTEPDPDVVLDGLRWGARGHVDWPHEGEESLESAIQVVLGGRPALSTHITSCILDQIQEPVMSAPRPDD